jgi:choline dehydrogenase
VLGGSSSINGMIYMRGQAGDYDRWAESAAIRPGAGTRCCRCSGAAKTITAAPARPRQRRRMARGAPAPVLGNPGRLPRSRRANGIPKIDDFNGGDNAGCAYFEVNQRRGIRLNTAKAFLKPASQRPNLTIMTGCHVEKLLIASTKGASLPRRAIHGRWPRLYRHRAPRNPAGRRRDRLADHPAAVRHRAGRQPGPLPRHRAAGRFPGRGREPAGPSAAAHGLPHHRRALAEHDRGQLVRQGENRLQYMLFQSGPMSMAPSQLGAFARSDASQATPNLQYHVQPLSLEKFGDPLHGFPAFTASVCNLRPTSRGHVRIASNDSYAPPKITPNYLSTPEDRQVAARALALTRRIVAAPALAKYRPEEFKPGPHYRTEEELAEAAGLIGTTIFHPVGTCRMGKLDDPLAVVDSELRVKGVRGLRVVDASIMPFITSGNTNSPTLMIAEKTAQLLAAQEQGWAKMHKGFAFAQYVRGRWASGCVVRFVYGWERWRTSFWRRAS